MEIKVNSVARKAAAGTALLALLTGCGGSGGGGGDPAAQKAMLTEENAPEAVGLGLMVDGFIVGFVGYGDDLTGSSSMAASARSTTLPATSAESRQQRAEASVFDRLVGRSRQFQARQVLGNGSLRSVGSSMPCSDGGNVLVTETQIKFDRCTEGDDWGDGDFWKSTLHGTVSLQAAELAGYGQAFKITMDLKESYEEVWNGWKSTEEWTQKGSLTIGSKTDATKIADFNFDLTAKGNYAGEKWDVRFWVRNFNSTSEIADTTEEIKYGGTVGVQSSDIKLNGSLDIATDTQLNYNHPYHSLEFPRGQAVKAVGANGSELRVEFSGDGGLATVSLNGEEIRRFSSWYEYEDWVDGDDYY